MTPFRQKIGQLRAQRAGGKIGQAPDFIQFLKSRPRCDNAFQS
jgi:hypothetical protein